MIGDGVPPLTAVPADDSYCTQTAAGVHFKPPPRGGFFMPLIPRSRYGILPGRADAMCPDIPALPIALREQPNAFALVDGWLRYVPSNQQFRIGPTGQMSVRSDHHSSNLPIGSEQGLRLYRAVESWRVTYWIPTQISSQLNKCFQPTNAWTRCLRRFYRFLPWKRYPSALDIYGLALTQSFSTPRPRGGDDGPTPLIGPKPNRPLQTNCSPDNQGQPDIVIA